MEMELWISCAKKNNTTAISNRSERQHLIVDTSFFNCGEVFVLGLRTLHLISTNNNKCRFLNRGKAYTLQLALYLWNDLDWADPKGGLGYLFLAFCEITNWHTSFIFNDHIDMFTASYSIC